MEVKVNKKVFEGSLKALKPIAPNGCLINVLNNIVLKTEEEKVSIIASNSSAILCYSVPAQIIEAGEIIVPAKDFINLVHNFTGKSLIISGNEEMVKVKDESSCSTLTNLADIGEFPDINQIHNDEYRQGTKVNVPGLTLKNLLSVGFASAQSNEYQYEALQGVLLQFSQEFSKAVATDTSRLALKTCKGVNTETPIEFFLRDFNVLPLTNIADGNVALTYTPKAVLFESNKGVLLTSIPESRFPDWQSVIPAEHKASARTSKNYLLNALAKCAPIARKSYNKAIKLEVRDGKCMFEAKADNVTVSQEISCITYEPFELLLNVNYLRDGVASVETDEVLLCYTGQEKPIMILPYEQNGYLYLLMPLRK